MPEATIVCVDNSEYMRNGDFNPTRLDAQKDSCNLICGTKLRSSPENSIGLMTMAKRQVIATLTTDLGKILKGMHSIKAEGSIDFLSALAVAQLVLKHRESKTHRQRIVVFVGSPIDAEEAQLVKLGKKLKKSNISVDVISFGEEDANQSKLEAFIHAVNKEESSHLVAVPSGSGVLSDSLLSSPILEGAGGAPGGGPSAGGNDFSEYGGIDPSADPELAMVKRIRHADRELRHHAASGAHAAKGANLNVFRMVCRHCVFHWQKSVSDSNVKEVVAWIQGTTSQLTVPLRQQLQLNLQQVCLSTSMCICIVRMPSHKA
eukprot:TRINITY_DN10152_c0_g1_i3.p1 TRINITY_DN10152_c0_g1~~TRINITY_DN10152_c0_g1_i3.p1  ORF type:complete len:318 (+),score=62.17 TRINITY_DN10152_c0_g1_i3:66-1019(+)